MHLDGFVFDYPDGYVATGSDNSHLKLYEEDLWEYNPDIIKTYITDVIHEVGSNRVAAFAELYPDDWSVDRGNAYGFDGIISDDAGNGGFHTVATAIQEGNASDVEFAFNKEGGSDALRSQCFHSSSGDFAVPWTRFVVGTSWLGRERLTDNNFDCRTGASHVESVGIVSLEECLTACTSDDLCQAITVQWNALSPIVEVDCYKLHDVNVDMCTTTIKECEPCPFTHSTFAVDASVKTRQAVALTIAGGNVLAVEQGADGAWWSGNDWPGRWDPILAHLHNIFQQNVAFSLKALRVQLPVLGMGHYAMLRYDHTGTGSAALAVFNMGANTSNVSIDLSALSRVHGHRPTNLWTGTTAPAFENTYTVEIPAHDMMFFGFEGLGTWTQHRNNTCPNAWSSPAYELDGCFLACLGRDSCGGVSVRWTSTSYDQVQCGLLDVGTEPSDCQTADGDHSTFFLSSPGATDIVVA